MKKGALFFDCFYAFSSLLSPLSLSRLHILSSKSKKLANANKYLKSSVINGQLIAILFVNRYRNQKNDYVLYDAFANAAVGGHLDLCHYFINLGATNFNWALQNAALGGHIDLCKYLIKIGATNINSALAGAALGGHLKLCKYFIKMGATNFNQALANAAKRGHLDLCKYFVTCSASATDLNLALEYAAQGGHKDLCSFRTKATLFRF